MHVVTGDMASIVDRERSGTDQVHNVECCVQVEGRERLDEVRDGAQAAQADTKHPQQLPRGLEEQGDEDSAASRRALLH